MRRLSLLVLSLTLALPAAAQVYQWRDAQGRINYSDTPPPTGAAKTVKPASRAKVPVTDEVAPDQSADAAEQKPATDGVAAEAGKPAGKKADPSKPKTMAEKETEFRQRKVATAEAEAKAEKERQRAAELARSCDQARSQIAGLKNSRRITRFNSEGQRELMDDAARTAEIENSQRYIDQNCR
ncbi:DUF4124 domain-containing protein [Aromatoleum toluclasticum]|uniref:DUF4124 domain-containing protein n=1 Tax=Aromatoleum toluclasticum TaxID=92003 RepID=UPI001D1925A4|nr:DUF4124 domain-containing protein [Aromatoleum toluclasticum]MCC4116240.1 DUF4124 domain-containing protein [Aromatoleum toluclasticum]